MRPKSSRIGSLAKKSANLQIDEVCRMNLAEQIQKQQKIQQNFALAFAALRKHQTEEYLRANGIGQQVIDKENDPINQNKYPFIIEALFPSMHIVHLGSLQESLHVVNQQKVQQISQNYQQQVLKEIAQPQTVLIKPKEEEEASIESFHIDQSSSSISDVKKRRNKIIRRKKSMTQIEKETKNIPKNYGKAIITFILKHPQLCKKVFDEPMKCGLFLQYIRDNKNINNITSFNRLLVKVSDPTVDEYHKAFRIFCNYFLKKLGVKYVFNSKIQRVNWHLKYRNNLRRAVANPEKFIQIKNI